MTLADKVARCYGAIGDHKKEAELREEAYNTSRRVRGEEDLCTVSIMEDLARVYENLGDYPKALELKEKQYIVILRAQGKKSRDTKWAFHECLIVARDHEIDFSREFYSKLSIPQRILAKFYIRRRI